VESKIPHSSPVLGVSRPTPEIFIVLSHVSEEGDTSEIDVASLSTLTHVATYIRGKVIALGGIPTPLRLCVHPNSSQMGLHGLPL
jgi:hypothetical protein